MHFFKNKNLNNKGTSIMKHYKYDPLTAVQTVIVLKDDFINCQKQISNFHKFSEGDYKTQNVIFKTLIVTN